MSKRAAHIHIYQKISDITFRCVKPGCTTTINGGTEYIIGLKAECPFCHATFIITTEHIRRKKIHCMLCTKGGKLLPTLENVVAKEENKLKDIFGDILKERGL